MYRFLGYLLVGLFVIGNLSYAWQLVNVTNNINLMENALTQTEAKYPHEKFALYDYKWQTGETSMTLSALLEIRNASDIHGKPIGFIGTKVVPSKKYPMLGYFLSYTIIDLTTNDIKNKNTWIPMNHEAVYDDLMQWMHGRKLSSTFSLEKYIQNKTHVLF